MELAKRAWFIRDHGTYKRRPLRFHIYVGGRHGLVVISELRLGPHISVPNFKHTVALWDSNLFLQIPQHLTSSAAMEMISCSILIVCYQIVLMDRGPSSPLGRDPKLMVSS
jgi:hypothetical protein